MGAGLESQPLKQHCFGSLTPHKRKGCPVRLPSHRKAVACRSPRIPGDSETEFWEVFWRHGDPSPAPSPAGTTGQRELTELA